jgi:hypothetical protein
VGEQDNSSNNANTHNIRCCGNGSGSGHNYENDQTTSSGLVAKLTTWQSGLEV